MWDGDADTQKTSILRAPVSRECIGVRDTDDSRQTHKSKKRRKCARKGVFFCFSLRGFSCIPILFFPSFHLYFSLSFMLACDGWKQQKKGQRRVKWGKKGEKNERRCEILIRVGMCNVATEKKKRKRRRRWHLLFFFFFSSRHHWTADSRGK